MCYLGSFVWGFCGFWVHFDVSNIQSQFTEYFVQIIFFFKIIFKVKFWQEIGQWVTQRERPSVRQVASHHRKFTETTSFPWTWNHFTGTWTCPSCRFISQSRNSCESHFNLLDDAQHIWICKYYRNWQTPLKAALNPVFWRMKFLVKLINLEPIFTSFWHRHVKVHQHLSLTLNLTLITSGSVYAHRSRVHFCMTLKDLQKMEISQKSTTFPAGSPEPE